VIDGIFSAHEINESEGVFPSNHQILEFVRRVPAKSNDTETGDGNFALVKRMALFAAIVAILLTHFELELGYGIVERKVYTLIRKIQDEYIGRMCWNADVSINTFLFSCLALVFVWYTNTYTKYKTPLFDNWLAYAAFLSVSSMQLVEFFLWRNLDDPYWNRVFSRIGFLLIWIQPWLFLLLAKSSLATVYFVIAVLEAVYLFLIKNSDSYTTKDRSAHLVWKWVNIDYEVYIIITSVWLLFIFYSLFPLKEYVLLTFGVVALLYSAYRFHSSGSCGSVWCWMINGYFIWLLVRVLIVLPLYDKPGAINFC
jgi:hypothetical protein